MAVGSQIDAQEPAIEPNLNSAIGNRLAWSWGMQFVPNQDLVVTELGWFDRFADGFENGPHPVAIYRVSDQLRLTSATIDNGSCRWICIFFLSSFKTKTTT